MNEVLFAAGDVIFRAGDPSTHAYLIRKGAVELLRDGDARVAVVGVGDVIGEMSLIEDRPHGLTARAVAAVKAHGLTREEFERLLTTDPETFRAYLKSLFERLRVLSARVVPAPVALPVAEPVGALTVTIHPLTRKAAETLPEDGLAITKFPFRIGRASEAREHDPLDLNDLWLLDKEPFHVSRNHALINVHEGEVIVEDRGSHRGVHVNDRHIGVRNDHTHAILEEGDNVVIMGGPTSPYQFRVHVERK